MVQSHVSSMQSAGAILSELIDSFGFYPENSLIIRWMKQDEVVLVQRCDITAFLSPEGLAESDLEIYIEPGRAYCAEKAAIMVCLESMNPRIHEAIQIVESAIVNADISMAQVFIAVGQRLYSRECSGKCDAHSIWLDTGVKRVDRAFECAINAARLIDVKEFPEPPEPRKLGAWREIESQFVRKLMKQTGDPIQVSDFARLAVALGDIRVRDSILWDMANGAFDRSFLAKALTGLLPQLQASHGAPIATAAAICWWLNGNGAMANLCLDRAFNDVPDYSLAAMVRAALDHALPPEFWLESINELTREQCLAGLDVAPETLCGYSST
jgi:hypothetical protein